MLWSIKREFDPLRSFQIKIKKRLLKGYVNFFWLSYSLFGDPSNLNFKIKILIGDIAQLVELSAFNRTVEGSNPSVSFQGVFYG